MTLYKKIPWDFEQDKFEICIYHDKNIISIIMFKDNHPANGFRYQMQIPKDLEIQKVLNNDSYSHLIEYCKQDTIEGRWDNVLQTISRLS